MTGSPDPLDVLVVGWFPAADDLVAGRFVADQVAALRASGRVRPDVVSFENVAIRGTGSLRLRQDAAIGASIAAAIERSTPFNPSGAGGPPGIPVARLAVAAGTTAATGVDHRAIHRTAAILPLADRPDHPRWRLVHAHVGYPEGAAAARAAARLDVPLIVTEHASFVDALLAEPAIRARYLETLQRAARVIAVSRMLAAELLAAIPALDGRLAVIPDAVAIDDFEVASPSERAPAELLWVGYRKEAKGIGTLLQAFRLVREERPDATLRLIGRSTTEAEEAGWHRLAGDLGVSASVRFESPADRSGVAAAMRRASCFVHPSTRETFGIVAVEALATGLPVVATDSGGVTEILGDSPDALGAVVPPSDPASLARAILRTLDRRHEFDPGRLRAYAAERFGAAAVAGRIVAVYDEVLDEAAQAAGDQAPWRSAAGNRPAAPELSEATASGRVLLVGFVRKELDQALDRFPAWCLAGVEIVTAGPRIPGREGVTLAPAGTDEQLAAVVDWGAPAAGVAHRIVRRLRRQVRRLSGDRWRWGLSDAALLARLAQTLDDALRSAVESEPPMLICLSGIDYLAAGPALAAGRAVASPGGLRWLADRRPAGRSDQARDPAAPSWA